jgi:hypothetical protein
MNRFRALSERHPSIGNVRGQGFMVGVEFVQDRATRRAWGDRAKAMRSALFARGVLMHTCGAWDQVLRFMAPLTIEDELLERGFVAFEDALESLDAPVHVRGAVPAGSGPVVRAEPRLPSAPGLPVPAAPPAPGRTFPDAEPS